VKQWSTMPSRVSLAPPPSETELEKALDKWADPAMPESSHLLLPHTQQLLRIARSGKYGTKRKTAPDVEPDGDDFNAREEEGVPDEVLAKPIHIEEKGFVARKWRQVPEAALVPEHLHWEFLAKRRKGLPSYYHGGATDLTTGGMPQAATRKTRVQKVLDVATGESVIYEVVALEGQVLENELPADSQMQAAHLEPGTTIEGLGTAGEDGLISLVPSRTAAPSRRNRPPPKKKGGPGRGKKRVTFTNPDGSTYTTIVPNATKIVPQPGQTVKHVAKGEDAGKDVSMEEAARLTHEAGDGGDQDEEGDEDDEGDDGDDDDEDREDGEIQENDAEVAATPAKKSTPAPVEAAITEAQPAQPAHTSEKPTPVDILSKEGPLDQQVLDDSNPDTDVEMQDQPVESEPETKPISEPVDQKEPQPVSQAEPVEASTKTRSHSPPKPEPQIETTQSGDAMDIEPAESLTADNPAASPETTAQEVIGELEPLASEVASEKPDPVAELEQPVERVEATLQPVEQVLEVEVEIAADASVDSGAPMVSEALKGSEAPYEPEATLQVQETVTTQEDTSAQEPPLLPAKNAESGEDDLLGSLERSLEG
jgi:hypothetical protein